MWSHLLVLFQFKYHHIKIHLNPEYLGNPLLKFKSIHVF